MNVYTKSFMVLCASVPSSIAFSQYPIDRNSCSKGTLGNLATKPMASTTIRNSGLTSACAPQSMRLTPEASLTRLFTKASDADSSVEPNKGQDNLSPAAAEGAVEIIEKHADLIASCKSLTYSVINPDNAKPELSYAPYCRSENPTKFFILASPLAAPSRSLLNAAQTGRPATIQFSSPEDRHPQIYNQERISLLADAEIIERHSEEWQERVSQLRSQYGKIVERLTSLPDFCLVALTATEGSDAKDFSQWTCNNSLPSPGSESLIQKNSPQKPKSDQEIAHRCNQLIASCKTLNYAVNDPDEIKPQLASAPFIQADDEMKFYLLASPETAPSRALIKAAGTGRAANLQFMRPEGETRQIYARERASLESKVQTVEQGSEEWIQQISRLENKFGQIIEALATQPETCLLALIPSDGRYVTGFGQAYDIDLSDLN